MCRQSPPERHAIGVRIMGDKIQRGHDGSTRARRRPEGIDAGAEIDPFRDTAAARSSGRVHVPAVFRATTHRATIVTASITAMNDATAMRRNAAVM